jgi:type III restriction enzyme
VIVVSIVNTERRFAVIVERDASKWFKSAKGQFQIYYKLGTEQPEYVPDFVVEMDAFILLAETKKRDDLKSDEVVAKAEAAVRWWKYVLVPHDEIAESKRLADFLRFEVKN